MRSKYFAIKELVCKHVYERYGEGAEMFLDDKLIETIHIIREKILKAPMIVNDWHNGGGFTQRGFRCNICPLVKSKTDISRMYLSAHNMGKAIDCNVQGMTAEEARQRIIANARLLPYPIRLEDGVSWLHIDVYDNGKGQKVTLFEE